MLLQLFSCCDWLRLTSQKCVYIHDAFAAPVLRLVARETQDFASLQAGAGGDDEVMGHCINMRKRLSDDE